MVWLCTRLSFTFYWLPQKRSSKKVDGTNLFIKVSDQFFLRRTHCGATLNGIKLVILEGSCNYVYSIYQMVSEWFVNIKLGKIVLSIYCHWRIVCLNGGKLSHFLCWFWTKMGLNIILHSNWYLQESSHQTVNDWRFSCGKLLNFLLHRFHVGLIIASISCCSWWVWFSNIIWGQFLSCLQANDSGKHNRPLPHWSLDN